MGDEDIVREFLIESIENLIRLDQEIVELERRPRDAQLLAGIFRAIHTIKGTCGFLGFTTLEGLTHETENILSELRSGQREAAAPLISLILETVDAVRTILRSIEETGTEGASDFADLRQRLESAAQQDLTAASAADLPPAAKVSAAPNTSDAERGSSVADTAIRVDVGLLDKLMNLVGELVLARNQVLQFNSQRDDASLNATSQRLDLITTELQEGVMKTRMQPIGVVWSKLPRLVRDISHQLGKQARLEMDGAGTELDRTIIEAIKDPLTHLIRNACDHGLERPEERVRQGKPAQGRMTLRAFHEGGQVNIEVSDDGAGIDIERLKQKAPEKGLGTPDQVARMTDREAIGMIFLPGFSTAGNVTSLSGRGVGMDVVKSNIEKIGGTVDIATRPGQGTTVKLKIPLTLAIIPGLLVTSGAERFVIPQVNLLELIRLDGEAAGRIEYIHRTPVYRHRGDLLPIANLSSVLGQKSSSGEAKSNVVDIVVLQAEDRPFGLVVDAIHDTQEIVVKPLGKQLKGLAAYAGATIMGDGRVVLILDVLGIGQRAGVLAHRRETERSDVPSRPQTGGERQRLLLFTAGGFERLAVPLSLISRLEEIPRSSLESASQMHVVQYRGGILPLVLLTSLLDSAPDTMLTPDPMPVIVFQDGERSVGVVVDRILDIVEEEVSARLPSARSGLLGSAVVGTRVADFLDLKVVMRAAYSDGGGLKSAQQGERRLASIERLAAAVEGPEGVLAG